MLEGILICHYPNITHIVVDRKKEKISHIATPPGPPD